MGCLLRMHLYPVFGQKLRGERPRGVPHHLIHVAAVLDSIVALVLIHHCEALEVVRQLIAANYRCNKQEFKLATGTQDVR